MISVAYPDKYLVWARHDALRPYLATRTTLGQGAVLDRLARPATREAIGEDGYRKALADLGWGIRHCPAGKMDNADAASMAI